MTEERSDWRCPDCGSVKDAPAEWVRVSHICPLYMEDTWRAMEPVDD